MLTGDSNYLGVQLFIAVEENPHRLEKGLKHRPYWSQGTYHTLISNSPQKQHSLTQQDSGAVCIKLTANPSGK